MLLKKNQESPRLPKDCIDDDCDDDSLAVSVDSSGDRNQQEDELLYSIVPGSFGNSPPASPVQHVNGFEAVAQQVLDDCQAPTNGSSLLECRTLATSDLPRSTVTGAGTTTTTTETAFLHRAPLAH